MFLSIGIKAQSYDDSNVHYYLPVGFSVENIYKNEPPSCIVIRGNSLDFYDLGDYGITQHLHNRKRFIEGIERKFQLIFMTKTYPLTNMMFIHIIMGGMHFGVLVHTQVILL